MHPWGIPSVGTKGSLPWRPWLASIWAARSCHGLDDFGWSIVGRGGVFCTIPTYVEWKRWVSRARAITDLPWFLLRSCGTIIGWPMFMGQIGIWVPDVFNLGGIEDGCGNSQVIGPQQWCYIGCGFSGELWLRWCRCVSDERILTEDLVALPLDGLYRCGGFGYCGVELLRHQEQLGEQPNWWVVIPGHALTITARIPANFHLT